MEIHVYDRNLRRLGHIENHTSLQWHRKYYECGTFELHCPVTAENLRLLQPGEHYNQGGQQAGSRRDTWGPGGRGKHPGK